MRDVVKSHAIARVGLVGTIRVHGVPVRHAAKRQLHRDPYLTKGVGERLLEHAHDIILRDEAHLDIHLRELGLTVRAQVLVAKASGDLVVALDTAYHEELLQELRRLRQRIEVPRLRAARDQEVTGALGRRLEERGRLDLHEGAPVKRLANREGEVAAQSQGGHHLGTTQVQVAIAQAHVLSHLDMVLDLKDGGLCRVQHLDVRDEDLYLASRKLLIVLALGTLAHDAADLYGPLGADGLGPVESDPARMLGVKGNLRQARTIAQVHEDKTTVIAAVPHPSGERDLPTDVLATKLTAAVRMHAVHVHGICVI